MYWAMYNTMGGVIVPPKQESDSTLFLLVLQIYKKGKGD